MILRCFLLFVFLNSIVGFSQNRTETDSLQALILAETRDTVKVELYSLISSAFLKTNLDSAQLLANKGLYLAKKIESDKGIGDLNIVLGHAKVIQNDMFQAMDNYLKAAEAFKKSNSKNELAIAYLVLGNVSFTIGNYPNALDYYQKGLHIADSLQAILILPDFYNNLGEISSKLQDYDAAIVNFNKGLAIREDASDYVGAAYILVNLSRIYSILDRVDEAQSYLARAHQLYEKISHNEGLFNVSHTYATLEEKQGNYGQAINYYKEGFKYLEAIGSEYLGPIAILRADYYSSIGYCYLKINNFILSEKNLLKGYEIAEQTGQVEYMQITSQYLSELYELMNRPGEALKYARNFKIYSDSISQEKNIKRMTQLEMQFDFDKKIRQGELERTQLESRQKRKELLYIMISSGILLALIILLLLYRLQKLKVKKIKLEKKTLLFDLDFKNKELTTNVMYLLKKNEFIINISDKLKKSRYDFKPENRKIVDDIIRELEHSTTEGAWTDFEVRFQEVHAGFYQKLNDKFPDLSPNELKLCAFLRLNMSTKEISTITFQSPKSISMARFRLRKKMGVSSYANLITYLNQI